MSEDIRHEDTRTVDTTTRDDEGRAVTDRDAERRRDQATGDERVAAETAGERQVPRDPTSERAATSTSSGPGAPTRWNAHTGLLPDDDLAGYRQRWGEIQARFIDEPRESVRQADDLVSDITGLIAERFTSSRKDFEDRWTGDDQPTTEELRQALQRLRDFFQRLVA